MVRISNPIAMLWKSWMVLMTVAVLTGGVDARSPKPPPIRRVHTPRSSLSILPRSARNPLSRPRSFNAPPPPAHELAHSDTIHLTVSIPDSEESAHLLLRPSEFIIHPNAFVRVDGMPNSRIRQEDYRLYSGEVIHPGWINRAKSEEVAGMRERYADSRGVLGTASVMVLHPGEMGDDPLWEGSFNILGMTYHVKPTEDYLRMRTPDDVMVEDNGRVVVYRDIDMYKDESEIALAHPNAHVASCGHDQHEHNSNLSHPIWQNRHSNLFTPMDSWEDNLGFGFGKRSDTPTGGGSSGTGSNYINSINSTQGCPNSQQIVYMGFALDCNYVQAYNGGERAREHILSVMNQVSDLYRRTFNISLGIIELEVENSTCPSSTPSDKTWNVGCEAGISLDERLSRFSQWRGGRSGDGAGLWHLMSACASDREVGVAWLGTVCQTSSNRQGSSTVSGTGVSTALQTEWSLVAHEIGHGFGAIHDCYQGCSLNDNCCPYSQSTCNAQGRFIMNPTTSSVETQFSGCTLGNICSNIGSRSIQTSCFQTPGGRDVISLEQCGNGIVDPGEDCDPGFNSTSPCCDPDTCKFRDGAVCDPTNKGCCTDSCQYASSGVVCRPAVDTRCDYEETCSGNSADCPTDEYRDDGTSCGDSGLECAAGRCTSLDQQCRQSSGSMNLTTACGQKHDTSCVISCRDPRSSNQCIVMQTPLLDGSPCGWAGRCYNQSCSEGSWQAQFASMYRQNLQISIPVTIVVSLIVLAILYFILRSCLRCCGLCGGRQGKNRKPRRGNGGPYPPPPMRSTGPGGHHPQGSGGNNPFALNPPPPAVGRHSGSVNSQDPITNTHVYGRDEGPTPAQQAYGGQHGWAYSGGGNGNNQAPARGWVDESLYNGPNYGRGEAYGR